MDKTDYALIVDFANPPGRLILSGTFGCANTTSVQRIVLEPEYRTSTKILHGAGEFHQLLTKWTLAGK